jgi:hypothetical protein
MRGLWNSRSGAAMDRRPLSCRKLAVSPYGYTQAYLIDPLSTTLPVSATA